MEYAVIAAHGKQYIVQTGTKLKLGRLDGKVESETEFPILLAFDAQGGVELGQPTIARTAKAMISSHYRAAKITVIKFKRKVRYRRKAGYRHPVTEVTVSSI